jgi:hypothetical protein
LIKPLFLFSRALAKIYKKSKLRLNKVDLPQNENV